MTTIPPAQPRPPSSTFTPPSVERRSSRPSLSLDQIQVFNLSAAQNAWVNTPIDDRPAKRRKLEETVPVSGSEISDSIVHGEVERPLGLKRLHGVIWTSAISAYPPAASAKDLELPPFPLPPFDVDDEGESHAQRIRTSCRIRAEVAVPNIPDSLQQPYKVPSLAVERPVDYFPWTGKHPEDVINEANVKSGYWDRAGHTIDRETNTARQPLYSAFKHRNGLDVMSALFSQVLEQKAKHGALSTSSTFRPPPRVTLTEAKRKSWISDLADDNVPLRRLSRTIPQGVRGSALLEQCLTHNVPYNRAIWFVKCVGANEIRTLKRKGANPTIVVGAEHKWLRDWSTNIEQFIEASVGRCGTQDWLHNLRYSLQLCARLYHENLLDREHFLDWLVKCFKASDLGMLAVWLSLVQMWQVDLIRFRRRATSLVTTLLVKLEELDGLAKASSLHDRLRKVIQGLMIYRPACFLMSDRWKWCKDTLKSCLDSTNSKEIQIFHHIEQRNLRLQGKDLQKKNLISVASTVFKLLDTATAPFDIDCLSQELAKGCPNYSELSVLCLQWATSKFRGSIGRTYLVARLLRRWLRNGFEIGNRILGFFSSGRKSGSVDSDSYRHIFAELSRSRSFSSSRFLQNLTLRGMRPDDMLGETDHREMVLEGYLLQDLSLQDAEEHLVNLKNHLLRGISNTRSQRSEAVETIKNDLRRLLRDAERDDTVIGLQHVEIITSKELDWSARFEISQWLRQEAGNLARLAMNEIPGKPPLPGSKSFSLAQYLIIRDVLETLGDIAVLADVLSVLSRTKQEGILAALVDTIHCNAVALSAIGALDSLQKLYGQAYITLRTIRPSLLLFATALIDICQYYPCSLTPLRALQQDLIRGDRGRALAACSPFSDGIAESLQQAGATFVDDFEAILQGEPNMSEQTMTSLFSVLVARIMKSDNETHAQNTSALCQLLARLRLFRVNQGDILIKKWISRLFTAAWSRVHQNIVSELIATRCVSVETLMSICEPMPLTSSCKTAISEMIASSLSPPSSQSEYRQQMYVVRIAAHRIALDSPARMLDLLLNRGGLDDRLSSVYAGLLSKLLDNGSSSIPTSVLNSKNLLNMVDGLLGIKEGSQEILSKIIMLVDWLSLPICRYRLELQSTEGDSIYGKDVGITGAAILGAIESKENEEGSDAELVEALINAMPEEVSAQVRAMTEQQFYNALPRNLLGRTVMQSSPHLTGDLGQCMRVVERLVSLGPARYVHATADANGMLIERLTIIHKVLGARGEMSQGVSGVSVSSPLSPSPLSGSTTGAMDQRHEENVFTSLEHLKLVTRVASMKAGSFGTQSNATNSASIKQVQTEQVKILALLASIATQPVLTQLLEQDITTEQKQMIRECMSFALDVAARIADDLSEGGRAQCAKILKEKLRDARIAWLVGCMNTNENTSGQGLSVMRGNKMYIGEFQPKQWEMLESGGGKEGDTCVGLGLFGARRL